MSERDPEATRLQIVAQCRQIEERILRVLDAVAKEGLADPRWLAIGRTDIEKGFSAVGRSILQPERAVLPEDLTNAG